MSSTRLAREQPVEHAPPRHHVPLARRFGESRREWRRPEHCRTTHPGDRRNRSDAHDGSQHRRERRPRSSGARRSARNRCRSRPADGATRTVAPTSGKNPMPTSGMREGIAVAGDAMRAVDRNADAAAHDDAVDQRHIRLRIALDEGIERIFLAKESERLFLPARRGRARRARGCRRRRRTRARRQP